MIVCAGFVSADTALVFMHTTCAGLQLPAACNGVRSFYQTLISKAGGPHKGLLFKIRALHVNGVSDGFSNSATQDVQQSCITKLIVCIYPITLIRYAAYLYSVQKQHPCMCMHICYPLVLAFLLFATATAAATAACSILIRLSALALQSIIAALAVVKAVELSGCFCAFDLHTLSSTTWLKSFLPLRFTAFNLVLIKI
jgi:hypothetical protein